MSEKTLFDQYLEKMASFDDDRYFFMAEDMLKGENSYLRMKFKGSSVFNPIWIKKIEDCLYELDQITNNPREVTTTEGAVMPIELAKKVNYESVKHLASHSQYIKDIDELGNVMPAKILGLYSKEELHTYENRFIATFIRRLILFIDKRYEFIKKTVSLDEKEIMYVKNKSIVNGEEVEIETKITVKRAVEDELTKSAREYIARIEQLKEFVGYYYSSPFMKEFKTEKDVRRPIIMTNILRKNPLYHKCYETFLFIEKFDSLGVTYKADRDYQDFNEKERRALNHILLSNLLFLDAGDNKTTYKQTEKIYKPKLLTSIDDEIFLYDDLLKGPIEYVRADERYLEYLKAKAPEDMPTHPNKVERKYYADHYKYKAELHQEVKEVEDLLARIRKAIAKYEKKVETLTAERNIDETKIAEEALRQLRQYEQEVLDKKRAEIVREGEKDKAANKVTKKGKIAKKADKKPVNEEKNAEETVEKKDETL